MQSRLATVAGFALFISLFALGAEQGAASPIAALSDGAQIEDERNTIDIFKQAAPATVYVTQTKMVRDMFSARAMEVPSGTGTGFIWDEEGHVVTNFHVVASQGGRAELSVTLHNQKSYPATVVGVEPRKDIAVLKIDAPDDVLVSILRPPRGSTLQTGQKTIAIGNPFGLDHTLTTGVVSALGREVRGIGGVTIKNMVQTDAAINPGNSGGPLLNSHGQLIGMNTMIFSQSGSSAGIGFAVPVATIERVVPQLINNGQVEQVGIGVSVVNDHVARRNRIQGVIIDSVSENSPAAQAGLVGLSRVGRRINLGDVIVGIDAENITNYDDLYNALDVRKAGEIVKVRVLREGEITEIPIELIILR
jgi:S1-C subfamily serine protease